MPSFKIRPANQHDTVNLVQLVNGAYRGPEALKSWTSEAAMVTGQRTDAQMIADDLAKGTILVAHVDQRLIGCVYLETLPNHCFYLGMLTIDPREQSRGLGGQLLEASEKFALEQGSRRLEMWVLHVRDTLIAWYARRGYHATGERMPFHADKPQFGIPLLPDLEFVRLGKDLKL